MKNINYQIDIQDYFEYFMNKHEKLADSPPIRIYLNKIEI